MVLMVSGNSMATDIAGSWVGFRKSERKSLLTYQVVTEAPGIPVCTFGKSSVPCLTLTSNRQNDVRSTFDSIHVMMMKVAPPSPELA